MSRPIPASHEQFRTANGSLLVTRSNGARAEIHDVNRGLEIHYGLNGSRRVVMERTDHSRVFAERGGGYVQHPYLFHGQEFAHRTYFEHGHEMVRFYDRHVYHGVTLEIYTPVRFYSVAFYGWVYQPWGPVWLTDYLITSSVNAAYAAQLRAQREEIAEEVRLEVQLEQEAARANARDARGGLDYAGIGDLLTDGHSHVFISGTSLDLVDGQGNDCTLTQGDVVQVRAAPAPGATAVNATVVVSKGGTECPADTTVRMALADLQEMQNYMRATVDQGIVQLQAKQGSGNVPAAPAGVLSVGVDASFMQGAPPADPNVQAEISEQMSAADVAEREDTVASN